MALQSLVLRPVSAAALHPALPSCRRRRGPEPRRGHQAGRCEISPGARCRRQGRYARRSRRAAARRDTTPTAAGDLARHGEGGAQLHRGRRARTATPRARRSSPSSPTARRSPSSKARARLRRSPGERADRRARSRQFPARGGGVVLYRRRALLLEHERGHEQHGRLGLEDRRCRRVRRRPAARDRSRRRRPLRVRDARQRLSLRLRLLCLLGGAARIAHGRERRRQERDQRRELQAGARGLSSRA